VLNYLRIKNIALIDELSIEFGEGLNLLTGETGSGKSIIVDSLGALTGDRVSSDLIREGTTSAVIEGTFRFDTDQITRAIAAQAGIEISEEEVLVRRELFASGKNRVFINDQLVTQAVLRRIGGYLADIHGQGEQAILFDNSYHLAMLDDFAGVDRQAEVVRTAFDKLRSAKLDLAALKRDEAEKLQLLDVLRFQVNEIGAANLTADEDADLEIEKQRLNNVEKLTALSSEAFELLYDDAASTSATLDKAWRRIEELSTYDPSFVQYSEGISSAMAVIDSLAQDLRGFRDHLEFSPTRLAEIEDRLAEIARLKRKYGNSVEDVLVHLATAQERLCLCI
jgi:DNA repair protein RecN (Recombination protein N)